MKEFGTEILFVLPHEFGLTPSEINKLQVHCTLTFSLPIDLGFLEFLDKYRFSVDSIQMMRCLPVGSRNSLYTLSSEAFGSSISAIMKNLQLYM